MKRKINREYIIKAPEMCQDYSEGMSARRVAQKFGFDYNRSFQNFMYAESRRTGQTRQSEAEKIIKYFYAMEETHEITRKRTGQTWEEHAAEILSILK
jgi:hypothetical protein